MVILESVDHIENRDILTMLVIPVYEQRKMFLFCASLISSVGCITNSQ